MVDGACEKYGMLTTTVAAREDAVKIAEWLLGQKLAACVQLMRIESFYSWKGEIRDEAEILLLIKTRADLYQETMQAITLLHPYETPQIVITDFAAGSPAYFDWIAAVTKESRRRP